MKLFKNWYWRGYWWFILIEAPKMKSLGGAVWPIIRIRHRYLHLRTLRHEKVHLKSQISIGILPFIALCIFAWSPWVILYFFLMSLPWLILYGIFHLFYGYTNNPFERYAEAVEAGDDKWRFLGFLKYLKK